MTKRLIIAAVFLLFSLTIGIAANIFIQSSVNELYLLCENAEQKNNDDTLGKLVDCWYARKSGLSVCLKHADADILSRYFVTIESIINDGNFAASENVLRELKAFLRCTAEGEKLKFENIF